MMVSFFNEFALRFRLHSFLVYAGGRTAVKERFLYVILSGAQRSEESRSELSLGSNSPLPVTVMYKLLHLLATMHTLTCFHEPASSFSKSGQARVGRHRAKAEEPRLWRFVGL